MLTLRNCLSTRAFVCQKCDDDGGKQAGHAKVHAGIACQGFLLGPPGCVCSPSSLSRAIPFAVWLFALLRRISSHARTAPARQSVNAVSVGLLRNAAEGEVFARERREADVFIPLIPRSIPNFGHVWGLPQLSIFFPLYVQGTFFLPLYRLFLHSSII